MEKLQMVFTVVLSGLTLILLYKQYRIQRYRVKMDLFDRRFKVYSHLRKFIHIGRGEGGTKLEVVQDLLSNIPEHEFIFDNDGEIVKYVNELWKKGLKYHHIRKEVDYLNPNSIESSERQPLLDELHQLTHHFNEEYDLIKNRFHKYLH